MITTILIKGSIALILLYGLFWMMFRSSTFYQLNRLVLFSIGVMTVVLPLLEIPTHWMEVQAKLSIPVLEELRFGEISMTGVAGHAGETIADEKGRGQAGSSNFPLSTVFMGIYLLGLGYFILRLGVELFHLRRLINSGEIQAAKGYTLIRTDQAIPPLAFFRYVVVNPAKHTDRELHHILKHEMVHVRQWHTLDILFMELFTACFWFHPFSWQLKKRAKLNLEFIADHTVVADEPNRKAYQLDLLKLSVPAFKIQSANHFNYSHIKTRITMMNCKRSTRLFLLKYLSLLPVLALLLFAFQPLNGQTVRGDGSASEQDLKLKPGQSIYMKISESYTEKEVNQIFKKLEETGVDLEGTKVAFNNDGKITRLSFHAAFADQHFVVESYNDGRPIKEPIVLYYSPSNGNRVVVGTLNNLDRKEQRMFNKFSGIMIGTFSSE